MKYPSNFFLFNPAKEESLQKRGAPATARFSSKFFEKVTLRIIRLKSTSGLVQVKTVKGDLR
jgi:hypothetical protein